MAEERLNPELLTIREIEYNEVDGKWYKKPALFKMECGGFLSLGAGATSADFSSQLTKTDLLTGVGTLSSAGIRFHLTDIIVKNTANKGATVTLYDSTGKKHVINLTTGSTNTFGSWQCIQGIVGRYFSTDCRVGQTTGPCAVSVGGYREVIAR